jgi:hypothetical protein
MSTHGPRFSHGYQFPRTDSARLGRGEAIRRERIPGVGTVEIVPLTGGRRRQWDVCATWTDSDGNGCASTYIATDELEANTEFVKLIRELRP